MVKVWCEAHWQSFSKLTSPWISALIRSILSSVLSYRRTHILSTCSPWAEVNHEATAEAGGDEVGDEVVGEVEIVEGEGEAREELAV